MVGLILVSRKCRRVFAVQPHPDLGNVPGIVSPGRFSILLSPGEWELDHVPHLVTSVARPGLPDVGTTIDQQNGCEHI